MASHGALPNYVVGNSSVAEAPEIMFTNLAMEPEQKNQKGWTSWQQKAQPLGKNIKIHVQSNQIDKGTFDILYLPSINEKLEELFCQTIFQNSSDS